MRWGGPGPRAELVAARALAAQWPCCNCVTPSSFLGDRAQTPCARDRWAPQATMRWDRPTAAGTSTGELTEDIKSIYQIRM